MAKKRKILINKDARRSFGKIGNDENAGNAETKQDNVDSGIIQRILDQSLARGSDGSDKTGDNELIAMLQKAQEAYGYIPRLVINEINKRTGISTSKIYGIVTFYDQFSTERRGKYTIKTCSGTACQVKGGKKSLEAIKKELGVGVGETTPDYQFTVETVGCLGACAISPAMLINKQLYGRTTQEKIAPILDQYSRKCR